MQKKYRLTNEKSFDIIYRKGKSVSDSTMVVICLKSKYNNLKVGFSVGKKIGNSVTRNLIKRRLKECFRKLIPDLETGNSYIIVARKPIIDIDFVTMGNNMEVLLTQLGKIKEQK